MEDKLSQAVESVCNVVRDFSVIEMKTKRDLTPGERAVLLDAAIYLIQASRDASSRGMKG